MSGWVSSPRMVIVPPSSSSTPQTTTGAVSAASRKSNRIVFSSLPIAVRRQPTQQRRVLRPMPTKSKDLDSPAVPNLNRVPLAMKSRDLESSPSPDSVNVPLPGYLGVKLIPRFPIVLEQNCKSRDGNVERLRKTSKVCGG